MRAAVLTLTRDRLDYTRHCFQTLQEHAGTAYDHFVLDQGSTDGTAEWLDGQDSLDVTFLHENVGISAGLNLLLDEAVNPELYDVIVKVDNDCELLTPNTLRDVCKLVDEYGLLLSPEIHGLRQPPVTLGQPLELGEWLVDEKAQIGGIFLAAPASLYRTYRYSEANPVWGGDDVEVCAWWRSRGGRCGYVRGYHANHYLTTDGQHAAMPEYFARTMAEGKAVL